MRETASENGRTITISAAAGTIGAAAGVAGGVLIGRTIAKRPKKILGISVPRRQADLSDLTRSIKAAGQQFAAAGQQFGKLASEVRTAEQKAEQIGKALTT